MNVTIYKNYAQAIYEIARDKKQLTLFNENLTLINDEFSKNNDFARFLNSPFVTFEDKMKVVDKVFKDVIDEDVLSFLKIVIERNLILHFNDIRQYFNHFMNADLNIVEGIIYSPFEISKEKVKEISEAFSKKINKKVDLKVLIDEKLIGGIKVIIQDKIFDYSVLNQINNIKKNMLSK